MGPASMRRLNSALLLDLIRGKRSVSRAELARLSGLTRPTVSSQVADLVRRGLVVEDGSGEPEVGGGKPPRLLRFNPCSGNLIGAEIGASEVRVRLADMDAVVLDREDAAACPHLGAGHILGVLVEAIKAVLARGQGRKRKLMAIAVAAPGRVDVDSGVVLEAGSVFHWRDVPVRERIESAFRVPTLVENDINLAAFGELHYGICRGVQNFVLIRLGTGVGAGLVLGGRVYQGNHWAAGEIGHMVFDREAVSETLDERGYLESAIGSDRLRERIRPEGSAPNGGLAEAVSRGGPAAAGILDDLAANLSLAAVNLVAALDPELIVLEGELVDLATDRIRQAVARIVPWPVRIEQSALGADGALMGALGFARGMVHRVLCGAGGGELLPLRKE
jgi:glucokinase